MINRELVRLKVVQLVYAYKVNKKTTWSTAEKELELSLSKAYDMYLYLLHSLTKVHALAVTHHESALSRVRRLGYGEPDERMKALAHNRMLWQLSENAALVDFRANRWKDWEDEDSFVAGMLRKWIDCGCIDNYLQKVENPTYEDDRKLVRELYKACYMGNDDLESRFEDNGIYWNDDKSIIDSFVIKTIKKFDETKGSEHELLPAFSNGDDEKFAYSLFRHTLEQGDDEIHMIAEASHKWSVDRMAVMDLVIVQTALAELVNFPLIGVGVTINEYINIAKVYSTPDSARFVNGVLASIVTRLRDNNVIPK